MTKQFFGTYRKKLLLPDISVLFQPNSSSHSLTFKLAAYSPKMSPSSTLGTEYGITTKMVDNIWSKFHVFYYIPGMAYQGSELIGYVLIIN